MLPPGRGEAPRDVAAVADEHDPDGVPLTVDDQVQRLARGAACAASRRRWPATCPSGASSGRAAAPSPGSADAGGVEERHPVDEGHVHHAGHPGFHGRRRVRVGVQARAPSRNGSAFPPGTPPAAAPGRVRSARPRPRCRRRRRRRAPAGSPVDQRREIRRPGPTPASVASGRAGGDRIGGTVAAPGRLVDDHRQALAAGQGGRRRRPPSAPAPTASPATARGRSPPGSTRRPRPPRRRTGNARRRAPGNMRRRPPAGRGRRRPTGSSMVGAGRERGGRGGMPAGKRRRPGQVADPPGDRCVRSGSGRRRPINGLTTTLDTKLAAPSDAMPRSDARRVRLPVSAPTAAIAHPQPPVVGRLGQQAQGVVERPGDRDGRPARCRHRVARRWHAPAEHYGATGQGAAASADRPAARRTLAVRAEERRTVHEGVAADRGAAPRAGPVLLAVGVQRTVEVAGLAVDVDVQRVERGPADGQRLASSPRWRRSARVRADRPGHGGGRPRVVHLGPPERLVGVDVADPGHHASGRAARV